MYGGAKNVAGAYVRGLRGLEPADCSGLGFGAIRAGRFFPRRPLEVVKPWQARTFAAAELALSMTLKSYWVQKP